MAVPKKRTSKSKKKHRNKVWRKKALSYIRSESKLGIEKLVPLTPGEKPSGFSSRRKGIKKGISRKNRKNIRREERG
uniref:Ribosomal protein L32 n=2 Tax=Widdringtonia TaxID=13759 RepID=A0A8F8XBH2_9CONI|nr:ribosomal protein L32 [Widdringtonia nodiflora]BBN67073.1 ribosomal protein L32 [Widdringtonia schwarzii]